MLHAIQQIFYHETEENMQNLFTMHRIINYTIFKQKYPFHRHLHSKKCQRQDNFSYC